MADGGLATRSFGYTVAHTRRKNIANIANEANCALP